MDQQVRRVHTDISEPQMIQAIISAWQELFGTTPTKQQVSMVIAQNNLETGHRRSMWNYNVGNITHVAGDGFDYWSGLDWLYDYFTDTSGITQKQKKTVQLKYRAYPNLAAGVKDYLKFLSTGRYTSAWQHILHPDPVAFSKALKKGGYYTADESSYTNGIKSLYNQSNNTNNYEQALSGKIQPANNIVHKPAVYQEPSFWTGIENTLNEYINSFLSPTATASKCPTHILIKISSSDYTNAIEYARVLCLALDESAQTKTHIHTDGHKQVEVECQIAGPSITCQAAVEQMSNAMSETFQQATKKIGGIQVKTECFTNKQSCYQPISLNTATSQYRSFHLKFV